MVDSKSALFGLMITTLCIGRGLSKRLNVGCDTVKSETVMPEAVGSAIVLLDAGSTTTAGDLDGSNMPGWLKNACRRLRWLDDNCRQSLFLTQGCKSSQSQTVEVSASAS